MELDAEYDQRGEQAAPTGSSFKPASSPALPSNVLKPEKDFILTYETISELWDVTNPAYTNKYKRSAFFLFTMSLKVCCVSGCFSSKGVMLYSFPNPEVEMERFRTWIMKIGGDIVLLENKYIFKNRKICSRHFHPKHIYPRKLSTLAIPQLHLPGEPEAALPTIENLVKSSVFANNIDKQNVKSKTRGEPEAALPTIVNLVISRVFANSISKQNVKSKTRGITRRRITKTKRKLRKSKNKKHINNYKN